MIPLAVPLEEANAGVPPTSEQSGSERDIMSTNKQTNTRKRKKERERERERGGGGNLTLRLENFVSFNPKRLILSRYSTWLGRAVSISCLSSIVSHLITTSNGSHVTHKNQG